MINLKKTYKFSIISALYITFFVTVLVCFLLFFMFNFNAVALLKFGFVFFILNGVFTLFVLQYRTEKFIYNRVKKLYDEISFLDDKSFANQLISTDLSEITSQVQQFASDKKLEIEILNERETFRREFLGNVSHELKTPLFTVQGYISTLLDGAMNDKNIRKKYLQRAEKGVERLIYIVEDLDMMSKLETGELNLELSNFNIVNLIQSVFDMLEMKATEKDIILMFDSKHTKPINVYADKEKIEQLVINLIVNSIKYGKEKGTTEVAIENYSNNKIIVKVIDNGEGIEKHNVSRLFERFFRVDKSGARTEGGSGLGLSIVKHIVEAHEERIFIDSTFGKGSEFSFTLEKSK